MIEWVRERIEYLMEELGLSEDEAEERATEDYFDDGDDSGG